MIEVCKGYFDVGFKTVDVYVYVQMNEDDIYQRVDENGDDYGIGFESSPETIANEVLSADDSCAKAFGLPSLYFSDLKVEEDDCYESDETVETLYEQHQNFYKKDDGSLYHTEMYCKIVKHVYNGKEYKCLVSIIREK